MNIPKRKTTGVRPVRKRRPRVPKVVAVDETTSDSTDASSLDESHKIKVSVRGSKRSFSINPNTTDSMVRFNPASDVEEKKGVNRKPVIATLNPESEEQLKWIQASEQELSLHNSHYQTELSDDYSPEMGPYFRGIPRAQEPQTSRAYEEPVVPMKLEKPIGLDSSVHYASGFARASNPGTETQFQTHNASQSSYNPHRQSRCGHLPQTMQPTYNPQHHPQHNQQQTHTAPPPRPKIRPSGFSMAVSTGNDNTPAAHDPHARSQAKHTAHCKGFGMKAIPFANVHHPTSGKVSGFSVKSAMSVIDY